jgi:NhaP-type Na+/H+ or K+/H+ antiporter
MEDVRRRQPDPRYGLLLLLGIASSTFSARLGVPVLVLFLGLGMLAGDGPTWTSPETGMER